jgi:hypothetical protein
MDGPLSRPLHKGIKVPASLETSRVPLPCRQRSCLPGLFFAAGTDRGIKPLLRYSIVSCPGQARVTGYAIRFARPGQGSGSGDKSAIVHRSLFSTLTAS